MYLTIAAYTDPLMAQIVRGRLEAEGIASWVADEHLVLADWTLRHALGGVKVRVARAQFEQARAIVRDLDRGAYMLDEEQTQALPACRESWSSRIAYVALFAMSLPLPWWRRSTQGG